MRVIDRVHRHAANRRAFAHPATASGFTQRYVFVLGVSDLADCRHAVDRDEPDFTGRQAKLRGVAFLGDELREAAGAAGHLAALARFELDIMNLRAKWNIPDRQRIAGEDIGFRP